MTREKGDPKRRNAAPRTECSRVWISCARSVSPLSALYVAPQAGVTPSPREMHAEVIGPYREGEHSLPKTEVEKADGVEPRRKPHASSQSMLLDLNFDLLAPGSFRAC